jgi:hypothetical protein
MAHPFDFSVSAKAVGAPSFAHFAKSGAQTHAPRAQIQTHPVSTLSNVSMSLSVMTESPSYMRDDDVFLQEHLVHHVNVLKKRFSSGISCQIVRREKTVAKYGRNLRNETELTPIILAAKACLGA